MTTQNATADVLFVAGVTEGEPQNFSQINVINNVDPNAYSLPAQITNAKLISQFARKHLPLLTYKALADELAKDYTESYQAQMTIIALIGRIGNNYDASVAERFMRDFMAALGSAKTLYDADVVVIDYFQELKKELEYQARRKFNANADKQGIAVLDEFADGYVELNVYRPSYGG